MASGFNISVGVDRSDFDRDLSYVNKQLKTLAGQEALVNLKLKLPQQGELGKALRKEITAAQKELRSAMVGISNVLYEKRGEIFDIQNVKQAQEAVSYLGKELKKAKASGDSIKIKSLSDDIVAVNEYIDALSRLSNAFANAGIASTSPKDAKARSNRASIDAEIKLLEKRRALMNANTSVSENTRIKEEIKLQKQLIGLLQKKNETYKNGSKANTQALYEAQRYLEELENKRKGANSSTEKSNSLLDTQAGVLGRLRNLATRYLSIFAVVDIGKKIVEITGYFEQQQVALQGILGSAAAAQKALNELKGMTIESPFELRELVSYTKQLSAYGIEQDKLLSSTKQLADISTGLGVDMSRLILAYGQVRSASVLRGQELRQFTEAGIPMVDALAKKFTELNGELVTTGEVFDLISSRRVPFEMVASVLSDMANEGGRFYKMQENITDTLYGQVQKLKDMWSIALNDAGSSINKTLRGIVEMLQSVVKNAVGLIASISIFAIASSAKSLVRYAKEIRQSIIAWVMSIKAFVTSIRTANGGFAKMKVLAKGIGKALASTAIMAALSAIIGLIINARQKAKEFSNALDSINRSFGKDTAKYVQGFDTLLGKLASMTEGTKEYNAALDTLKSNYGDFVNPELINQLIAERKQLDDTAEGWGRLRDSVVEAIRVQKEYEKHEALKEKAGGEAAGNADNLSGIFGRELQRIISTNRSAASTLGIDSGLRDSYLLKQSIYEDIYNGIKSQTAEGAYQFALGSFFENDKTTKEDLQAEIERSFDRYGVAPNVTQYVLENIDKIWKDLSDTEYFKQYAKEVDINANSPQKQIEKRFSEAQRTTAGRQELRWSEGMSFADYNPAKYAQAEDYDLAVAARDLIGNISETIAEKNKEGGGDRLFVGGQEGITEYEKALSAFNEQVTGMSEDSFVAAGKTKQIADAMQNLASTINDSNLRNLINQVTGSFTKLAGIKTGRAAEISTAIEENLLSSGVLSKETKDAYARYIPTDANIDENRKSIKSEYDRLESEIKSYGSTQGNKANAEYVKTLKEQQKILKVLAGDKYYDIDLSKSTGGSVSVKSELTDFINSLKNAYETYKNATQKGGVEMGLGYVRNDEQFQEMFGQFFGGKDSEAFKKLDSIKVGDKSVSTMLQDKFITDGLENGILDFEDAAKAVADELMAYYKEDTTHRRAFKNAGDQLLKWVETTIAKDNLSVALETLNKEIKDLSRTFEMTTQNVETYRKLIQNGTADTLGKDLGISRSDALQPKSVRQRENANAIVAKYNEQLSVISKGKGSPYQIGNLDNISDVIKAIENLDELQKMNGENFGATELGQTASTLVNVLKELIKSIREEKESISGERYTGSGLSDIVANAKQNDSAGLFELQSRQTVARQYGTTDQAATKERVSATQQSAQAIYDQFLKENPFETLGTSEKGFQIKIDFDQLEKKLKKVVEQLPEGLGAELEQKLTDLKISVDDYNAKRGAPFGEYVKNYRNAGRDAKEKYDQEVLRKQDIEGNIEDNRVLSLDTSDLEAQLAACNERLLAMGVNGEKLKKELQEAAKSDIAESIEKADSALNNAQNAVTGIVDAAMGLVRVINEVYDVMNDGENPAWMQDMESFLGDFGEAFKMCIAPITAVIGVMIALNVAAAATGATLAVTMSWLLPLLAVAIAIAGIVAAFKQHDKKLERANEELDKQIEATNNEMKNLNSQAGRMTGFDKWGKSLEAAGKNLENYRMQLQQAQNEEDKKNTDDDKVAEYKQNAQESLNDFYDSVQDLRDELTGTVESLADSMSSAMRSAFQSGENAARAMKATVKEAVGDIIENMLKMTILEPLLEEAFNTLLGGNLEDIRNKYTGSDGTFDAKGYSDYIKARLKDEKAVKEFEENVNNAGDATLDAANSLDGYLKEAYGFNSDRSSLSSGIESITEDTARTLEGLFNSQLGVTIQIRQLLEDYLMSGGNTSGGNGAVMAGIQTHVSAINSNVALILQGLNEVRDTQTRPIHVTMV